MDKFKLPKLGRETKMLVNAGVYALYVLQANVYPGAKFVMYTDSQDDTFLLSEDGDIVNSGKLGRYPIIEAVDFPTIRVPYRTRK